MSGVECRGEFETSAGRLHVVDHSTSASHARAICRRLSGELLSVHNQALIDELSGQLVSCVASPPQQAVRFRPRYVAAWRLGLQTGGGVGNWTDGAAYEWRRHGRLFLSPPLERSSVLCEEAFLLPEAGKLLSLNCLEKTPFLCVERRTTAASETPRVAVWVPCAAAVLMFVFVLAVVAAAFFVRRSRRRKAHAFQRKTKRKEIC